VTRKEICSLNLNLRFPKNGSDSYDDHYDCGDHFGCDYDEDSDEDGYDYDY
jgi:hypothetical protein